MSLERLRNDRLPDGKAERGQNPRDCAVRSGEKTGGTALTDKRRKTGEGIQPFFSFPPFFWEISAQKVDGLP